MSRLTETRDDQVLDQDDQTAIAFLETGLMAAMNAQREALVNQASSPDRVTDQSEPCGPALLPMSRMCPSSSCIMAVATMKAQAHGRFSPQAHWWGDILVAFDSV